MSKTEIVGYKTMYDKHGKRYHEPMTSAEAEMLWKKLEAEKVTCVFCNGNGAIAMSDSKVMCNQCGGAGRK